MITRWKSAALALPFVAGFAVLFALGIREPEGIIVTVHADASTKDQRIAIESRREKVKADLENFFASVETTSLARACGLRPPRNLRVDIYQNREQFLSQAARETLGTLENNGGYFNPNRMSIVLTSSDKASLQHEAMHALFHKQHQPMPLWLSEGLAVYFEKFKPNVRWGGLSERSKKKANEALKSDAVSVRDVLRASGAAFTGPDNSYYYALSAAIVAMLIEERQEDFERMVAKHGWQSEIPDSIFEQYFGENYNLQEKLTAYLGEN